jgi:hypothetical protein
VDFREIALKSVKRKNISYIGISAGISAAESLNLEGVQEECLS